MISRRAGTPRVAHAAAAGSGNSALSTGQAASLPLRAPGAGAGFHAQLPVLLAPSASGGVGTEGRSRWNALFEIRTAAWSH